MTKTTKPLAPHLQRLMEASQLHDGIARGERALEKGHVVTHKPARERLGKWLKTKNLGNKP